MQFSQFSHQLQELEGKNSRLEMMYQLAELYKSFELSEIKIASYLLQGSLVPAYLSLEFQLSVKMVLKALAYFEQETLRPLEEVTAIYKKSGDIGLVAFDVLTRWQESTQAGTTTQNPTIVQVYDQLVVIAKESGAGSQERKLNKLVELFKMLDPTSAKFVARIIIGKLRLGFSAMTILDALSWGVLNSKAHRSVLENAYQKRADIGDLAHVYMELAKNILQKSESKSEGDIGEADVSVGESASTPQKLEQQLEQELEKSYQVAVGIPVVNALCQRLNTAQEIIEKMGEVIAEPKYDGLRVQIHYSTTAFPDGSHIRAFTRNLEEATHMFPELQTIASQLSRDCIFDAEAIGYDPITEKLLPFQETITRKRKHDVLELSQKLPIRFYIFDVLYLGFESLLNKKLRERKELLEGIFEQNQTIKIAEYITTNDAKILHEFHEKQLAEGLEGAVIKQVDSAYQSGRKGWSWVKIKETEGNSGKLKDTLDLIIMGYYFGRGKRSEFGIGAFLVGILDSGEKIKTIAKIGTGISEAQLTQLKTMSDELAVSTMPTEYVVEKGLTPDVWIVPKIVVEIAADEITKSPNHSAGVALRFPRLLRIRNDKKASDATIMEELSAF